MCGQEWPMMAEYRASVLAVDCCRGSSLGERILTSCLVRRTEEGGGSDQGVPES